MSTSGTGDRPRPSDLRVEYETKPTNVDPTDAPRFGWRVDADRRGASQTAHRVVVGRDRDAVADGIASVWDSGRVESSASANVDYDGPTLGADETYYWSVKCWTDAGETPWADPESFATALAPEDWRGEWIAHQPGVGDTNGWRGRWRSLDWDGAEWVQVDLGEVRRVDAVSLHPAEPIDIVRTPDDTVLTPSWDSDPIAEFGFPEAYRIEVADDPSFEDASTLVEARDDPEAWRDEDVDVDGQFTGPVSTRTHDGLDAEGRYVRVTATDPYVADPGSDRTGEDDPRKTEETSPWACFALAGLAVEGDGEAALANGRPVTTSSSVETDTWGHDHLVNGHEESRLSSESPLLRRTFDLDGEVAAARLHVATVGYGECSVNGERVDDSRLDPAWTEYERRVLYSSHDVTDRLEAGENAIGLWLGRGRFATRSPYWLEDGSPRTRVTLTVEFADGTVRRLSSGSDWRAAASPLVEADLYDGERYDAGLERDGWDEPSFDDAEWDETAIVGAPGGVLRPQRIEPMGVVETFDVEAVRDHPDGPILDFGQNLTGWLEIEIEGAEAGQEITLRHAETLTEDGALSTVDLRTADAVDTYVASGEGSETYEPRFTYHGFRYAQVHDYPGEFDPDAVTAKVVHTAMDRRGEFACSNEDLNQVQHNAVWGLRGNAHSIPEDCPQRDERFGWTGDAQICSRAMLFNFDAVRFHEKWARDHDDAQSPMGYVPDVIPNKSTEHPADPTWSVTRVMLPWYLYRHDGDESVLREHYDEMGDYVDYWLSTIDDGVVPAHYGKFGDWLTFENADGRRGLPYELFNTAFVYQVTDTFAKIADVVGSESDAATYRDRADEIATAFNDRFFDPETAVYGPGTQSSFSVPLFVGLVPDEHVEDVVAGLVEKVNSDGGTLKTGFLGTRPLIHTLATHGHADLAYEVVSQPERPGWVYMARNGATTMWERWNSDASIGEGMNSLNHSPFTHVSEFFYEVLAGIRIDDRPMTEHVTIAPALVADLDWVEASLETRNGTLAVDWERTDADGDGYALSVTVPWNAAATVRLPDAADATVTESGENLVDDLPDGLASVEDDDEDTVVEVGAGTYEFAVE